MRVAREAQRLSQNFGFCSKHEVAGAFRIVLSTALADSCIKVIFLFSFPYRGKL